MPGGDSQRSGPLAVSGRRPSQGPRATADRRRGPGLADQGVAPDARAGPALAASRTAGSAEKARRRDCHLGARRHVGYRRRPGVHRRGRLGLDLRGSRPLEWRVRGPARVQGTEPFCGPRAGRARAPATLRLGRDLRGPRAGASRSWPIAPPSRPARSTSYATPRSLNVCPSNRVRYNELPLRFHDRTHRAPSPGRFSLSPWAASATENAVRGFPTSPPLLRCAPAFA